MPQDKYLRVDFGDNDFGLIVESALTRLWKFVRENNSDLHLKHTGEGKYSFPELFKELHKANYLLKLIYKGLDCEYNWYQIEYVTRGLYRDIELYDDQKNALDSGLEVISNYLNCNISFHPNNKFTKKWNNGESACLNLLTGKCKTF